MRSRLGRRRSPGRLPDHLTPCANAVWTTVSAFCSRCTVAMVGSFLTSAGSRRVKVDPGPDALDHNVSAHHVAEALADRQPQAGAPILSGR